MISALLINLAQSTARLDFQKKQLKFLGIPVERLSAISMSGLNSNQYEALANGWERKLRPAEVACFLSHQSAWQYVADHQKPFLILEDDALLSQWTPELLLQFDSNLLNIDLITLETHKRKKLLNKKVIPVSEHFDLQKLYQDRTGAAAYILFPSGANKLLNKSHTQAPALADAFISSCYTLKAYQTVPAAAIQLDQCEHYNLPMTYQFSSTITPENNHKPKANTASEKYLFKIRRIASQIRMALRHLSVSGVSERKKIEPRKSDFDFLNTLG